MFTRIVSNPAMTALLNRLEYTTVWNQASSQMLVYLIPPRRAVNQERRSL